MKTNEAEDDVLPITGKRSYWIIVQITIVG